MDKHKNNSVIELLLKFGAELSDAAPLLLKARKLGREPVGIAFHVGSQTTLTRPTCDSIDIILWPRNYPNSS